MKRAIALRFSVFEPTATIVTIGQLVLLIPHHIPFFVQNIQTHK